LRFKGFFVGFVFTGQEDADEHCQVGALRVFHQRVCDWLDKATVG
jgi:hypothetical protein